MTVQMRPSTVGYYNPVARVCPTPTPGPPVVVNPPSTPTTPVQPPVSQPPTTPQPPVVQPPVTGGGGGISRFLSDAWSEGKAQTGVNVGRVLHPIKSVEKVANQPIKTTLRNTLVDPYLNPIKEGRPGLAVGHLLANAAAIGAAVLGFRFLGTKLGGGGASVGTGGGAISTVGKVVAAPFKFVGNLASRAIHGVTGFLGGIFHGGGAHVGF